MNKIWRKLLINGKDFHFCHPENDDTSMGTLSCIEKDKFHIRDIKIEDGDNIIDIGSNIGLVSMIFAFLYPKCQVYAFDASEIAIDCFNESLKSNNLTNVTCYNLAVGAKEGVLHYASNGKEVSCLVRKELAAETHKDDYVCSMVGIDQVFESPFTKIEKCKYLKMDIEGGEYEVFDFLFNKKPYLLNRIEYLHLEVHPFEWQQQLTNKIKDYFGPRVFFDT